MHISGKEFFGNFWAAFRERFVSDGEHLAERLRHRPGRTQFMKDLMGDLARRFGDGRVACEPEFYRMDFCFWDTAEDPFNKMKYRQPLHVLALVEHEGGVNPEEEFWKLLHWYAPLKVVICYEPWAKLQRYFDDLRSRVDEFLPRSPSEEYLVIVGRVENDSVEWRGYLATPRTTFAEIQAPEIPNPRLRASRTEGPPTGA